VHVWRLKVTLGYRENEFEALNQRQKKLEMHQAKEKSKRNIPVQKKIRAAQF
jgi:hypothetical protein